MAGLAWFDALDGDNSRDFWLARRDDYEHSVRHPFEAMLAEVDGALVASGGTGHGGWRVHRAHQDARFSRGGPPLKTFIAATATTGGGSRLGVRLDSQGLAVSAGIPTMATDQLVRWRAAVDDASTGDRLATVVADLRRGGIAVGSGRPPSLRGTVRGFPASHPRVDLLRWRGAEATVGLGRAVWLDTAGRAPRVAAALAGSRPLLAWLDRHVGPATTQA